MPFQKQMYVSFRKGAQNRGGVGRLEELHFLADNFAEQQISQT
jgi:hypothetical protein